MAMATLHGTPIPTSIATTTTRSQSAPSKTSSNAKNPPSSLHFHTSLPSQEVSVSVQRRNIMSAAITGAIVGLINVGEKNAWAAARRPPPPPPEEKKDPNISGVQAKVLASKKRKEAMKQAMAEARAKGKSIQDQEQ